MYEELVKRLRHNAINADSGNEIGEAFYQDVMQAADAIEELARENESLAKSVNEACGILRKRWIPVTERLPQGGDESGQLCENVILMLSVEYNEAYVTCGWINGVTKKAYYLDEIDDFIHKTDISNVKAWMPLPEPPKEE